MVTSAKRIDPTEWAVGEEGLAAIDAEINAAREAEDWTACAAAVDRYNAEADRLDELDIAEGLAAESAQPSVKAAGPATAVIAARRCKAGVRYTGADGVYALRVLTCARPDIEGVDECAAALAAPACSDCKRVGELTDMFWTDCAAELGCEVRPNYDGIPTVFNREGYVVNAITAHTYPVKWVRKARRAMDRWLAVKLADETDAVREAFARREERAANA